ncbi:MAG: DUF3098 domain-containing protein [Muribaculaceae bacterium]|nr:DUF3098 domain-containing protein [Muribaculaceae bacterium]
MADNYSLFPKKNLLMMAGCLVLIILGFVLMSGGSSSVEGGFNPDIFSTRRIIVGPTVAFLGFLLMAFAIIAGPRKKNTDEAPAAPLKESAAETPTEK